MSARALRAQRELSVEEVVDRAVAAALAKLLPSLQAKIEYLSAAELGRRLGKSRATVDRWARGGCPSHMIGATRRFLLPEVVEWAQRAETHEEQPRRPSGNVRLMTRRRST